MMKEDWTYRLRQRLEGHKTAPPAGLWEGISKQIGIKDEPTVKPKVIKRWYWTAAAVLVLAGFFVFKNLGTTHHTEKPLQAEAFSKSESPQSPSLPNKENPPVQKTEKPYAVPEPAKGRPSTPKSRQTLIAQTEEATPEPTAETTQEVAQTDTIHPSDKLPQEIPSAKTEKNLARHSSDWEKNLTPASAPHKWSVGLNASGGLLALQTFNYTKTYKDTNSYLWAPVETGTITVNYEGRHHLPIRIGLHFQYQLNHQLSLISGVSYSYLYSEFTKLLYEKETYTQTLHYIGIPLGLAWQFGSAKRFHFYVSGQTMLEKCLNDKPWQLSVSVAAGAEYDITRQTGLYVEPSLGYYFDDGSSLEHYYKEHPLTPSLEFGLRFRLNE